MNIFNYIVCCFNKEKDNHVLWLPLFFIIGIILRFNVVRNVDYFSKIFLILFFICILFYLVKNYFIKSISILLIFLSFGYLRTNSYIKKYNLPIIEYPLGKVKIIGTVEKEIVNKTKQNETIKDIIVLVDKIEVTEQSNITFANDLYFKNPRKLKIRLSNSDQEVHMNFIVLTAFVFPIKEKSLYSEFDKKRYLYFQQIGGLGYRGEIIFNNKEHVKLTIKQKIDNLRFYIANKVINVRKNSKSTGIISILLTGQKNLADKQTIENMNYSGLAHLLSISGLHMMILITCTSFLIRWFLLRFERISLKYDIFKISVFGSLIINFLYLLLSGSNISAVRAYIMSVILLLSVIIGRFNTGLRSVMFVMFLISFIKPYIIFFAGFQMSFMAVIALISTIENYNNYLVRNNRTYFDNFESNKYIEYFKISLILSFAVECATTPFSVYNFNNYSFYNVLINCIVTPLMSFFILPLSLLSLFLIPFNLEFITILPASYLMDIIIYISNFIVKMPHSVMFIQSPNNFNFCLMIISLFWYFLWSTNCRRIGIYVYIFSLFLMFTQKKPDVIIDNKDNMILFFDNKNEIYVLHPNIYKIMSLIKKFGKQNYYDLDKKGLNGCLSKNKDCSSVVVNGNEIYFYKNNHYIGILKTNNKFIIINNSLNVLNIE